MSKITRLTAPQYLFLHKKIIEKFRIYCKSQNVEFNDLSVKQKYGYSTYKNKIEFDKDLPNLQKHIIEDADFDLCIKNNIAKVNPKSLNNIGKQIYEKYRKAEKGESVPLSRVIYTKAIFRYMGYNGANDFLKQYGEEVSKSQISIKGKEDVEDWVEYVGYFCSSTIDSDEGEKHMGILSFVLSVNTKKKNTYTHNKNGSILVEYDGEMQINHFAYEDIAYTGVGTHCLETLSFTLTSNRDRQFHLVFAVGKIDFFRRDMLRGNYTTTSDSKAGIISSETFIVKKEKHNLQISTIIKQYLRNNHNQLRIQRTFFLRDLKNPNDGDMKLSTLVGSYYWIEQNTDGRLSCNKLIIKNSLECEFIDAGFPEKKYVAFIKMHKSLLHVEVGKYIDEGNNRIATLLYAMLEYEYPDDLRVALFMGEEIYYGLRGKSIKSKAALIKADNDIPPHYIGKLNREKVQALMKQDERFKVAFTFVLEMGEKDRKRKSIIEKEQQNYAKLLK